MRQNILQFIILFACFVISLNALRNIFDSYNVGSVYDIRKNQVQQQYAQVIKKKNELDYINTAFFAEKQLRESLNYYRTGERLVVFTHKLEPLVSTDVTTETKSPYDAWINLLTNGISAPKL